MVTNLVGSSQDMIKIVNVLSEAHAKFKQPNSSFFLLQETRSNLFHNVMESGNIEALIDEIENSNDLIFLLSCFSEHS